VEELNRKTVEGVKEATAKQIAGLQEKIKELELQVDQQQETLDRKVKLVSARGRDDVLHHL
jgi:tetrahydromethanopterin S-methyltransferase subunit B